MGWLEHGESRLVLDVDSWEEPRWVLIDASEGSPGWTPTTFIRRLGLSSGGCGIW